MRVGKAVLLALTIPALVVLVHAQTAITVDEQTLRQHVDHRVAPLYPPIAKAALIEGTVVFDIGIGTTGKIESMKVVSGPAMLRQAAMDGLKQWTFKPFVKDGSPSVATGRLSIIFDLGNDHPTAQEDEIASRYFPVQQKCQTALGARDNSSFAAVTCKQAALIAEEFGPEVRFIEKRSAYVSAAWALANNGRFTEALTFAQDAVDVVKLGHDDNSGSSAAYFVLAVVEGELSDFKGADRDLTTAEDFGRKGIAWAESVKFEHMESYKWSLAQELQLHATLLKTLNRPADAQEKLDEAAGLK
jgi:TonB family protein